MMHFSKCRVIQSLRIRGPVTFHSFSVVVTKLQSKTTKLCRPAIESVFESVSLAHVNQFFFCWEGVSSPAKVCDQVSTRYANNKDQLISYGQTKPLYRYHRLIAVTHCFNGVVHSPTSGFRSVARWRCTHGCTNPFRQNCMYMYFQVSNNLKKLYLE